eukprot:1149102-Pelagomonas_calceolata.AAC.5
MSSIYSKEQAMAGNLRACFWQRKQSFNATVTITLGHGAVPTLKYSLSGMHLYKAMEEEGHKQGSLTLFNPVQ